MGISSHSFHCVRTGLRSEETVNGHLEVGENICLWRYGGLVIPQRDSASHASLCSAQRLQRCSFVFFNQSANHAGFSLKHSIQGLNSSTKINSIFHFPIHLYFSFYSMFFLLRDSQQDLELGTQLQRLRRLWLNSKPGVHDVLECSASPVSPRDKLDWSAHFHNALLSWPGCFPARVKPAPYMSSTLQFTLDFTVFVFFMLDQFFSSSPL